MAGDRLGSGVNAAFIYAQGGTRRLFEVPSVTDLSWGRSLCDISPAHVTAVPPDAGDDRRRCCELLGRVHPWMHELVMYRDGERVWEGPVTRVKEARGAVVIDAKDVLGWTQRRSVQSRVTPENTTSSILTEGELDITRAFSEHDPNVLTHRQVIATGTAVQIARDLRADAAYYADDLTELANQGLNFTVVGRKIILWNHTQVLGRTNRLIPSAHIVEDVEFVRDGMGLATRVKARNDNDEHGTSEDPSMLGVDADYGLVEWIEAASSTVGIDPLTEVAIAVRKGAYPVPLRMVVPGAATLNCDAPFLIAHLVPGVSVPVQEYGLCWDILETMVLSGLHVAQSAGVEEVKIDLTPLNAAVVE